MALGVGGRWRGGRRPAAVGCVPLALSSVLLLLSVACRSGKPPPAPPSVPPAQAPFAPPHVAPPTRVDAERALGPIWAAWHMPNPPSSGLPHPASYDSTSPGVVLDRVTGLMWQRAVAPASFAWSDAVGYCDRLELGGHADWRLPARIELVSIVDVSRVQPSIAGASFPDTPSEWFWTSSRAVVNPQGAAWDVDFNPGVAKIDPTNTPYRARCVRTPQGGDSARWGITTPPPYDIRADMVSDRGTKLTWQRAVVDRTFNHEEARRYCAGLRLGGKAKGWRVPSVGELLTVVDERSTRPTIDARAFPGTPGESFWTSSLFAGNADVAWHVYFEYGNASYGPVKDAYRVRCVRDSPP